MVWKKYLRVGACLLALTHIAAYMLPVFANQEKPVSTSVEYEEIQLIATAYYSPLPGQKRYLRWNYESEIQLNGNGTHGASGKAVFSGMIAAPKTYEFGTKIWIEWLGIGSVEDRGWAIVAKGNRGYIHDRVDIWMWEGEEGLMKALTWGKRTVKARVYKDESVKVAFDTTPLNTLIRSQSIAKTTKIASERIWSSEDTNEDTLANNSFENKDTPLGLSDELEEKSLIFAKNRIRLVNKLPFEKDKKSSENFSVETIRNIQESLKILGYFTGKSTGNIGDKTREAIAQLQKDNYKPEVIRETLGVFDEKTRNLVVELLLFKGVDLQ